MACSTADLPLPLAPEISTRLGLQEKSPLCRDVGPFLSSYLSVSTVSQQGMVSCQCTGNAHFNAQDAASGVQTLVRA